MVLIFFLFLALRLALMVMKIMSIHRPHCTCSMKNEPVELSMWMDIWITSQFKSRLQPTNTERNYVFIATTELNFLRTCLNVSLYACKFTSTVDSKPGVEKVRTQGVIAFIKLPRKIFHGRKWPRTRYSWRKCQQNNLSKKTELIHFNLIKFSLGIGWIQWCNTVSVWSTTVL